MIGEPVIVMLIEDNIDHAELVFVPWKSIALGIVCSISWTGNLPWIICFGEESMLNRYKPHALMLFCWTCASHA